MDYIITLHHQNVLRLVSCLTSMCADKVYSTALRNEYCYGIAYQLVFTDDNYCSRVLVCRVAAGDDLRASCRISCTVIICMGLEANQLAHIWILGYKSTHQTKLGKPLHVEPDLGK